MINFDITNKNVIPVVNAKQGDTDRDFKFTVTENGVPYNLTSVAFSAWYDSPSGKGNYDKINSVNAFVVSANQVTLTLHPNMLLNHGDAMLAVVMNKGGKKIATWNILVRIECLPGYGSSAAADYYEAFKAGSLADDIAAVNSRVTQLVTTTTPPTNAELIDIRTEFDGTVADSAGDAVREQFRGVYNQFIEVTDTQPTSQYNKIQVMETDEDEVTLPDMDDFNGLKEDLGYIAKSNILWRGDAKVIGTGLWDHSNLYKITGLSVGDRYYVTYESVVGSASTNPSPFTMVGAVGDTLKTNYRTTTGEFIVTEKMLSEGIDAIVVQFYPTFGHALPTGEAVATGVKILKDYSNVNITLTQELKNAIFNDDFAISLIRCFRSAAWAVDNGQDILGKLCNFLGCGWVDVRPNSSITVNADNSYRIVEAGANRQATGFIPVKNSNITVSVSGLETAYGSALCFDSNKHYIGRTTISAMVIPAGTRFIRIIFTPNTSTEPDADIQERYVLRTLVVSSSGTHDKFALLPVKEFEEYDM